MHSGEESLYVDIGLQGLTSMNDLHEGRSTIFHDNAD